VIVVCILLVDRAPPLKSISATLHPTDQVRLVRKSCEMITAYVLIQAEVGKAGQVASAAAEIDGVQQAEPLAGPFDVIVRAEARSIDALGRLVVSRIQAIHGVTRTLTCSVVHL
jgi:DNA-binding Lrp family transcriptional regulator